MNTSQLPFAIRHAEDRGITELRWLYGRHSFSFGRYYDPNNMAYRSLRVMNEDVIQPNSGFGEHGHENMEILTWVLEGTLHHHDSTGGDGELRPGELQAMTAGSGIRHSEVNDSPTDRVHLLQIWIEPSELNLQPSYTQKTFPREGRHGMWQLLASTEGRDDSLCIHQDAALRVAEFEKGQSIALSLEAERYAYVHAAYGAVQIDGVTLKSGDAITFSGAAELSVSANADSQILFFNLA